MSEQLEVCIEDFFYFFKANLKCTFNYLLISQCVYSLKLSLDYDATVIGVPFDGGCTYRPGTRFGPQVSFIAMILGL
jgi:hypothetical protein